MAIDLSVDWIKQLVLLHNIINILSIYNYYLLYGNC